VAEWLGRRCLALTYGAPVLAGYLLVGLLGWSRVAVRDHSWLQAAGGAVLGAAAAALACTAFLPGASCPGRPARGVLPGASHPGPLTRAGPGPVAGPGRA